MKSFKDIIQEGGVGVIRTDTLYGIVADAHNPHAVDRVYDIKGRNPAKASIVLVADYEQVRSFGVVIVDDTRAQLARYWPGKVSIILRTPDTSINTHHIHRGTGGIAFRMPDDKKLQQTLKMVGPLIAPSANPEGQAPARTIQEAVDYFGDKVDYYEDGGEIDDLSPSKIIKLSSSIGIETIRE